MHEPLAVSHRDARRQFPRKAVRSYDASEHLSVVKASVRREVGMMLARESARMHHDMAGELAAGRAQVELEDDVPQLGAAHLGDYFDDDAAGVVVVGAL